MTNDDTASFGPAYHQLTATADRIVATIGDGPVSEIQAIHLRHNIIAALLEVRHDAAIAAAVTAWTRAREVVGATHD